MRQRHYCEYLPRSGKQLHFLFASLQRVGWGPLYSILAHRALGWLGEVRPGVFSCGTRFKIDGKRTADYADYAEKGTWEKGT